jgi:hypothetical protein
MNNLVNNKIVKLFVIFLAALSPFLYIFTCGQLPSISSYWETPMQPLFIFINASTSYYLFSFKNWWIPSFFLMLLTAFSVSNFFWTHNIFAILFFISCAISITKSKYKFYIIPYLISLIPLIIFKNILISEIIAVLTICTFHLHRYIKYNQIKSIRTN